MILMNDQTYEPARAPKQYNFPLLVALIDSF